MVLKRSWPAVSQICNLTELLSNYSVLRYYSQVLELEVYPNGCQVGLLEGVVRKTT